MSQADTRASVEHVCKIKDLPKDERPRERLLKFGAGALSNAELLAILLRTGVERESALGMGQRLLSRFSSLGGIATASYESSPTRKALVKRRFARSWRLWILAGAWLR